MANKVVVISGASSGIGEELAKLYASKGAKLVLSARRLDRLSKVAESCSNAAGVEIVACDVSIENDCKSLIAHSITKYGGIDYLILNAGVGQVANLLFRCRDELVIVISVFLSGSDVRPSEYSSIHGHQLLWLRVSHNRSFAPSSKNWWANCSSIIFGWHNAISSTNPLQCFKVRARGLLRHSAYGAQI